MKRIEYNVSEVELALLMNGVADVVQKLRTAGIPAIVDRGGISIERGKLFQWRMERTVKFLWEEPE